MAPDVLVHHNGCGDTYIQALYLAELGDRESLDIGVVVRLEAEPELLMPEYKGAFFGDGDIYQAVTPVRLQGEQGVAPFCPISVSLLAKAIKAGMKMSEFMREAAAAYQPGVEDDALEAMIEQMNVATESAGRAIDRAIKFVAESNSRIEQMEAAEGAK